MFGERAFCEIRMFKLFAQRHKKMEAKKCFRSNENENKQCEQVKNLSGKQVLQVENRSFTPTIFAANDGMGKECIYKLQIAGRKDYPRKKSSIINIRALIPFSVSTFLIRFLKIFKDR